MLERRKQLKLGCEKPSPEKLVQSSVGFCLLSPLLLVRLNWEADGLSRSLADAGVSSGAGVFQIN